MVTNSLKHLIHTTKSLRGFNAHNYLSSKCEAINGFFRDQKLDSVVMGLSGGIDSAVTFALLNKAAQEDDSAIRKVLGLLLPVSGEGTTNQDDATSRGMLLKKYCNDKTEILIHDLSESLKSYVSTSPILSNTWAKGQLASIVRTPALYYHAAILQTQGYKSIVSGTINRDEGSYLGFFGKASDAMTDLQPIADLHKSEVYEIAELLDVPAEIKKAIPAGDVWDAKTDEEMIGAPYWFIEAYLLTKEFGIKVNTDLFEKSEKEDFIRFSDNIEKHHLKNRHKYCVGNPSHFIDVMNRKIPGGW